MKTETTQSAVLPVSRPVPVPAPQADAAPQPVPRFLSRREVASRFGVSVSTITRWARSGLIAAMRTPGGHYRYHAEDVRRAMRASEAGGTDPRERP